MVFICTPWIRTEDCHVFDVLWTSFPLLSAFYSTDVRQTPSPLPQPVFLPDKIAPILFQRNNSILSSVKYHLGFFFLMVFPISFHSLVFLPRPNKINEHHQFSYLQKYRKGFSGGLLRGAAGGNCGSRCHPTRRQLPKAPGPQTPERLLPLLCLYTRLLLLSFSVSGMAWMGVGDPHCL